MSRSLGPLSVSRSDFACLYHSLQLERIFNTAHHSKISHLQIVILYHKQILLRVLLPTSDVRALYLYLTVLYAVPNRVVASSFRNKEELRTSVCPALSIGRSHHHIDNLSRVMSVFLPLTPIFIHEGQTYLLSLVEDERRVRSFMLC